jgi:hypothetical protein
MTGKAARLVASERTRRTERRARLCTNPLASTSLDSPNMQIVKRVQPKGFGVFLSRFIMQFKWKTKNGA